VKFFGVDTRETVIERGTFNCPHCGVARDYVRMARQNYGYILGLPLIAMDAVPDLIACETCGQGYNIDVLAFRPSRPHPSVAKLLAGVKARLAKGYTADYILQDLVDQGVTREIAQSAVEIAQRED
jgi:hypothetical protein